MISPNCWLEIAKKHGSMSTLDTSFSQKMNLFISSNKSKEKRMFFFLLFVIFLDEHFIEKNTIIIMQIMFCLKNGLEIGIAVSVNIFNNLLNMPI